MAGRIKPSDASAIADVLLDEDLAGTLTPGQLRTMSGQLQQYQEQQQARVVSYKDQGYNDEQVALLIENENEQLETGANKQGGTLPKGNPATARVPALARAINSGAEGVWKAIEGMGDLTNEVGVALNLNSREDADHYKAVVRSNRFEREMSDLETFGRQNNRAMEFVGEVVPWAVTGTVGGGGNLLRYALTQGLIGGTAAASVVSDEDLFERKDQMLIGGAAGSVLQAAFGAPQAVRRWAANRFMKDLNLETSANNIELEEAITQMLNNESFGFSLSQVTGNRFVFGLEQRAAGHAQKKMQNNNIQALFNHIKKRSIELGDAGKSADEIGLALRSTLQKANKEIHTRASKNFETGLDNIMDTYGDDIILDYSGGQDYLYKIDDLLGQLDDPLRPGVKPSKSFLDYRKEVDTLVNPVTFVRRTVKGPDGKNKTVYDLANRRTGVVDRLGLPNRGEAMVEAQVRNRSLGGLQAGELVRIKRGLNDMLAGRTAVVEGSGDVAQDRQMSKALFGQLTDALESNNKNADAVQALDDLSNGYKAEMLRIGKMEELVVNRMFGQAEMPFDADKALDVVMGGGKSSLKNTREFLTEWDPALLNEVRGAYLRRIAEKSIDPTLPAVDVPISLDKMANALKGGDIDGIGTVGMGLFDDATQADLRKTGEALRTIKNLYFTGVTPSATTLDDVAINIISRSPEFMARFVTRVFSSGEKMSNALLDPLLRKAIQTLATAPIGSKTGAVAMRTLTHFLNYEDGAERQRQEQEAQQNNRQAAGAGFKGQLGD